jgi:NAD(P)H dehydrogenase (quinone)
MILVTGANGHLGRAVIHALLDKGVDAGDIIGLVREEDKALDLKAKGVALRIGDYDWYTTLVNAFQGVEKLVLVSARDLTSRFEQHENVITAAKEVGVKHLMYTSLFDGNNFQHSPFDFVSSSIKGTDSAIRESGIPYTLFKNNLYMELLPVLIGERLEERGIYLPMGEGKASYVNRFDIAEAIATVCVQEGHLNKTYNISNSEDVSLSEIASMLSVQSGRYIKYTSPSREEYMAAMESSGMPHQVIKIFAAISEAVESGEFQSSSTDLDMLLGRKPISVKQFLRQTYFKVTTVI